MSVVAEIFKLLGGVAVFLLGIRLISVNTDNLSGKKFNELLSRLTKNRFVACGLGAASTAIAQSSVATNIVAISFVGSGAITFYSACALVVGTNIGTTMTAQLVALKFSGGIDITALGSLIAFSGFLISTLTKGKVSFVGNVLLGFGLIFIGIEVLERSVEMLKEYSWFNALFLVKSPPILLLNGFFITAVCQSSSVVSSLLVVFAGKNMLGFSSAIYLIMGANIGTCLPVIFASIRKSDTAMKVAVFNIIFNIFGTVLFCALIWLSGGAIINLFRKVSLSTHRQIANFHSFFNLFVGIIVLIFLEKFIFITEKLTNLLKGKGKSNYLAVNKIK